MAEKIISEEWRPVVGREGEYEVSDFGSIRSLSRRVTSPTGTRSVTPRILKQFVAQSGYVYVSLGKVNKKATVHGVVAEAFLGDRPASHEVNHISGCKTDNRACNLEYVSPKTNSQHAWATGLCKAQRGSNHGGSRITEHDVKEIRRKYQQGLATQQELAHQYGVGSNHICRIVRYERWRHV